MTSPSGNLVTLVAFDPDGNPRPLKLDASGNLKLVQVGGSSSSEAQLQPFGKLVTPVGFDPDSGLSGLSVDANGYLKVSVQGLSSGNFVLIEDKVLSSDAAYIEFLDIPQTYKQLKIFSRVRSNYNGVDDIVRAIFNNDTSSIYQYFRAILYMTHAIYTTSGAGVSYIECMVMPGNTALANTYNSYELSLLSYSDIVMNKSMFSFGGDWYGSGSTNVWIDNGISHYGSTNAISRIKFYPRDGTLFKANSRMTLYGLS